MRVVDFYLFSMHVLVNVLFIDREESVGNDLGVKVSATATGGNCSLNVITFDKSDVVNLDGDISAGFEGSEGSGVFPVFSVRLLVDTGTVLN